MSESNQFRIEKPVDQVRKVYLTHENPESVWAEVIQKDVKQITEFYTEMKKNISSRIPWFIVTLLAKKYYRNITQQDRKYINECLYFAELSEILSPEEMVFMQVQTTIANYFPGGCTTVTTYDENRQQMACMRSLDWGAADEISRVTRVFDLTDESGNSVGKAAGISGMVGLLTAVKKGYSVVGNYAPGKLDLKMRDCLEKDDPSFLMRKLIEDDGVNTYCQALERVRSWENGVGAPFFITLCGVEKGEACTVEFVGKGEIYERPATEDGILIQTNHYPVEDPYSSPFKERNKIQYRDDKYTSAKRWYCSKLLKNSQKRTDLMKVGLLDSTEHLSTPLMEKLMALYRVPPVMNYEAAQWVLMYPTDATMELTSLTDAGTCFKGCNFWRRLTCSEK